MCGAERERRAACLFGAGDRAVTFAALRRRAERALYRAVPLSGAGDVRLETIGRLALEAWSGTATPAAIERFRDAEVAMEVAALRPNHALLRELAAAREKGKRVVAISDTPHRADDLWRIARGVVGDEPPLDALHTSADHRLTKRDGGLFEAVARQEGFAPARARHQGDDALADGARARAAGLAATVVPRSPLHHSRRRLRALLLRFRQATARPAPPRHADDAATIGTVVADGIHRLWLHLRAIELLDADASSHPDGRRAPPVVLFCARGGLTMHALLKRFVERTGVPLRLARRDLMVSRIVACRAALASGGAAAYDECAREFRHETMGTALRALCCGDPGVEGLDPAAPFSAERLRAIVEGPAGEAVRDALAVQRARFEAHLRGLVGSSRRVVLVDTGLYGSTMRLLSEAFPDIEWQCVLLARANYKGLSAAHFGRTVGLWCERDLCAPHDARSVVLRYWQWVEDVFEPDLPSVREFGPDGTNLQRAVPDWRERVLRDPKPPLAAALCRIDDLSAETLPALHEASEGAWRALRRLFAFPSRDEAVRLAVGERSRDFGLEGSVTAFTSSGRLAALRAARWKEGAVALHYPRLHRPAQWALEALYAARWARAALRR